jgi:hypothetical protein
MPVNASSRVSRALWVVIGALYLSLFPYHPKLRSPNELCRLWQTRALVEYGTLELNRALVEYGYVGDLSVKDGRYYPSKAPLLSFAAVPIYALLRLYGGSSRYAVPEIPLVYWSRLLLTALPTLAILIWLRRFLRTFIAPSIADALTATYALGSLAFSYSLLFMSHQPAAVLLFASFYALWRCGRGDWRHRGYLFAGACAGAALACEYTAALGIAGLVLYGVLSLTLNRGTDALRLRRTLGPLGLSLAGALPFVLALALYHQRCFGHPLETGYLHLADSAYQPWHLGGFLGIRLPDLRALLLSLFSPLRGLFTLAPFLFFAIPGFIVQFRRARGEPEQRVLFVAGVAVFLGYLYFSSAFSYESWGWTTGPRHLTTLVPFLLLPAGLFLHELASGGRAIYRYLLAAAAGACAVSVAITGSLTMVNYIPDSTSNALYGLALPLFRAGDLPPTVEVFFGIVNPWSGGFAFLLLCAAAVLIAAELPRAASSHPGRPLAFFGIAVLIALAYLATYRATFRDDAADRGALLHLRSVWLAPPHAQPVFWPKNASENL